MRPARLTWPRAGAALAAAAAAASLALPVDCSGLNEVGHLRATRRGDMALGPAPRRNQLVRFERACGGREVGGGVTRAPYLQVTADGQLRVLWTGAIVQRPGVALWEAGHRDELHVVPARVDASAHLPSGAQYAAELGRLPPGTVHCYQVRDGSRALAGPIGFTSPPPPRGRARRGAIRVVALGDLGYRTSDQRAVRDQLQTVEFDLAILPGDIAYPRGRLGEYERNLFRVYAPLMSSAPFLPASGNHDYMTDDASPFRQVFSLPENGGLEGTERWYSVDWGDLHVAVLDTERIGPAQERWLEEDLTRAERGGARWVIATFHRPPFSSGDVGPDPLVQGTLLPILLRHRVALVICGHDHDYERFHPKDGVTFLITGGGGRGTRPIASRAPGSAFAMQVAHFVYLVVDRDEIRLWAIDASGQTFDTARIHR